MVKNTKIALLATLVGAQTMYCAGFTQKDIRAVSRFDRFQQATEMIDASSENLKGTLSEAKDLFGATNAVNEYMVWLQTTSCKDSQYENGMKLYISRELEPKIVAGIDNAASNVLSAVYDIDSKDMADVVLYACNKSLSILEKVDNEDVPLVSSRVRRGIKEVKERKKELEQLAKKTSQLSHNDSGISLLKDPFSKLKISRK